MLLLLKTCFLQCFYLTIFFLVLSFLSYFSLIFHETWLCMHFFSGIAHFFHTFSHVWFMLQKTTHKSRKKMFYCISLLLKVTINLPCFVLAVLCVCFCLNETVFFISSVLYCLLCNKMQNCAQIILQSLYFFPCPALIRGLIF